VKCETQFFQKHVNKPRITNHKPIVYCWALSHFSFAQHRIKLTARLLQSADEEVLQDASLHAPEEISARVLSNRRDDEAITTLPIGSMVLVYMLTIRVNYNISLTWMKAIWGWFLLLTMIPVRSQWGRYNLPRTIANIGGILMGSMLPYIAAPWIRHGLHPCSLRCHEWRGY